MIEHVWNYLTGRVFPWRRCDRCRRHMGTRRGLTGNPPETHAIHLSCWLSDCEGAA